MMARAFHSPGRKAPAAARPERELKFDVDPSIFDAAFALPLLGGPDGGSSRRLESVYFDTEDGDLARAGVALRVRSDDGAFVLGLKTAPDSDRGAFEREELETPSPVRRAGPCPVRRDDRPRPRQDHRRQGACGEVRLRRPPDNEDGRVQRRDGRGRVRFRLPLRRRAKRASPRDRARAQIRRAGGVVRLRSSKQSRRFRSGSASKARRSARGVSCRMSRRRRSARIARRSRPKTPLDEGIGAVLRNCLSHFLGNLPALASGDRVEAVHQMRVAMRRLRSALGLFNRAFRCAEFDDLQAESRRIATILGEARDWDVLIETLRAGPLPRFADEPGFDGLLRAVASESRCRPCSCSSACRR